MKQYFTRKNIGLLMAILFAIPITMGALAKITLHPEVVENLSSNGLSEWIRIIGVGELISLLLFLLPQTFRLGAMLLAAYWGGAIMWHMTHTIEEKMGFTAAVIYFVITLVISWVRGMELVQIKGSTSHP